VQFPKKKATLLKSSGPAARERWPGLIASSPPARK
jgi:hypothetical protein